MKPFDKVRLAADVLKSAFENASLFHKARAREFPNDVRHSGAVVIIEALTGTIVNCNLSVLMSFAELGMNDNTTRSAEIMQDMARSVGFPYRPDSAEDFIRDFIKRNVH